MSLFSMGLQSMHGDELEAVGGRVLTNAGVRDPRTSRGGCKSSVGRWPEWFPGLTKSVAPAPPPRARPITWLMFNKTDPSPVPPQVQTRESSLSKATRSLFGYVPSACCLFGSHCSTRSHFQE